MNPFSKIRRRRDDRLSAAQRRLSRSSKCSAYVIQTCILYLSLKGQCFLTPRDLILRVSSPTNFIYRSHSWQHHTPHNSLDDHRRQPFFSPGGRVLVGCGLAILSFGEVETHDRQDQQSGAHPDQVRDKERVPGSTTGRDPKNFN